MPVAWENYRHYKSTGWSDYTYEVIDIALHTETWEKLVVYKPLYTLINPTDSHIFARPLSMREEELIVDGNNLKRFTKID